jgi:regulatory protein
MRRAKDPPTILQRAVAALSRREHSRAELARKLRRFASADDPAEVDRVLDGLQSGGLLSEERFVASFVRTRAARFGSARIAQEMKQHRVGGELARDSLAGLKASELERATALWQRRFGAAPASPEERHRQMRFLAARGFSTDVVLKVLKTHGRARDD